MGGDGKRPEFVIAVIENKHLRTGQNTGTNSDLAEEIRARGIKPDQCGHIIAVSLGGRMEYCNLIPQGKTTNIMHYHYAEKLIKSHIEDKTKKNPWALIKVRLIYENKKYPNRPTRFYYTYRLYKDKEQNEENIGEFEPELIQLLPQSVKIECCVCEKVRTRAAPNRVQAPTSTSMSSIWGTIAVGFQFAAGLLSIFGPTNIPITPAPAPEPAPVPVLEPVPLPVPSPPPVVVPPPFPITVCTQPMQLFLDPSNLTRPLVLAST